MEGWAQPTGGTNSVEYQQYWLDLQVALASTRITPDSETISRQRSYCRAIPHHNPPPRSSTLLVRRPLTILVTSERRLVEIVPQPDGVLMIPNTFLPPSLIHGTALCISHSAAKLSPMGKTVPMYYTHCILFCRFHRTHDYLLYPTRSRNNPL